MPDGHDRDRLTDELATLLAEVSARVRPRLLADPGDDALWAVREAAAGLRHLLSGDPGRLAAATGHLERAAGHARQTAPRTDRPRPDRP
ncbi:MULTISPECIES: hypothetical protein [Nocardiopsis]|uniref:Uncharacterized protein n=1 Tax=Nocardiopsis changdeensis TaxID=2831969 RepID=A0ABX8BZW9_9ACTN|nr:MULTISPECIES: hypothetical protein [Nocardiopsis]QUX26353.1 hypothetical protein KGD84_32145 [Nocardiopsis changdeensis]QYX40827.1 hypothetical protein K1J57_33030 [Nocardiopsis sp. MT53]